jgi:archaellum component FlaC
MKIETIKKSQMEATLEMENLGKVSGAKDASITNGIQDMQERIPGIEHTIEDIDTSVKENTKCKKFLTQDFQKMWDTMKRPNLGIEEAEDHQFNGPENLFNKIIEENFP